jgi:hypothetical protein
VSPSVLDGGFADRACYFHLGAALSDGERCRCPHPPLAHSWRGCDGCGCPVGWAVRIVQQLLDEGVRWCCPPPTPSTRYLHFTSADAARVIVASRRLTASDGERAWQRGVFACQSGGDGRHVVERVLGPGRTPAWAAGLRPGRAHDIPDGERACVAFETDVPPDWSSHEETAWSVPSVELRSAEVVGYADGLALLDGRVRLAVKWRDGTVACLPWRGLRGCYPGPCRRDAEGADTLTGTRPASSGRAGSRGVDLASEAR